MSESHKNRAFCGLIFHCFPRICFEISSRVPKDPDLLYTRRFSCTYNMSHNTFLRKLFFWLPTTKKHVFSTRRRKNNSYATPLRLCGQRAACNQVISKIVSWRALNSRRHSSQARTSISCLLSESRIGTGWLKGHGISKYHAPGAPPVWRPGSTFFLSMMIRYDDDDDHDNDAPNPFEATHHQIIIFNSLLQGGKRIVAMPLRLCGHAQPGIRAFGGFRTGHAAPTFHRALNDYCVYKSTNHKIQLREDVSSQAHAHTIWTYLKNPCMTCLSGLSLSLGRGPRTASKFEKKTAQVPKRRPGGR